MKTILAVKLVLLLLLTAILGASLASCGSPRGTIEIWLEGVSMGNMSMEGKPISGLPSQKTNLVIKGNAREIHVSNEGGETVLRLLPSDAKIFIGPDGMSLEGFDPEQVEIRWETPENKD
jgi:hypothetical protein